MRIQRHDRCRRWTRNIRSGNTTTTTSTGTPPPRRCGIDPFESGLVVLSRGPGVLIVLVELEECFVCEADLWWWGFLEEGVWRGWERVWGGEAGVLRRGWGVEVLEEEGGGCGSVGFIIVTVGWVGGGCGLGF